MSARHIHRFANFERRKKGLAGALGRTELVFACECGMTTEEHLEQLRAELDRLEREEAARAHAMSAGHFGDAKPGSMPPC